MDFKNKAFLKSYTFDYFMIMSKVINFVLIIVNNFIDLRFIDFIELIDFEFKIQS